MIVTTPFVRIACAYYYCYVIFRIFLYKLFYVLLYDRSDGSVVQRGHRHSRPSNSQAPFMSTTKILMHTARGLNFTVRCWCCRRAGRLALTLTRTHAGACAEGRAVPAAGSPFSAGRGGDRAPGVFAVVREDGGDGG